MKKIATRLGCAALFIALFVTVLPIEFLTYSIIWVVTGNGFPDVPLVFAIFDKEIWVIYKRYWANL